MEYLNNSIDQAIADLRKVIETNPSRDRFPNGTVIRWVAAERFTYAAIKTNIGWFTTARPNNPFVPSGLIEYETLQEILGRSEITNIAVATSWSGLDGSPIADNGLPFNPLGNVNDAPVMRQGRGLVSGSRAGLYGDDTFDEQSGESI